MKILSYKNKYEKSETVDVQSVFNKIKALKKWSDYEKDIDEMTKLKGDAFKIAQQMTYERKPESSQLRKFYDEVLKGYTLLKSPKPDVKEVRQILSMLRPRIMYASARGVVKKTFVEFINSSIDMKRFRTGILEDFKEDYNYFIKFFESIVGYHRYLSEQR